MKLRQVIVLITVGVTLALMVGVLALCRYVLLNSYSDLEQRHLFGNMQRTKSALDAQLQVLDRTLQDYATWDDTYRYIKRPTVKYAKVNLAPVALQILRLRTVLILNKRRRVMLVQRKNAGSSETDIDLQKLIRATEARKDTTRAAATGIVELSDGPVLVAVRPVLPTSGKGKLRGYMVMARDLDYRMVAELSSAVNLPIAFRDIRLEDPQHLGRLMGQIQRASFATEVLDSNRVAGFLVMKDVWGRPILLLKAEQDRDIWREGVRAGSLLTILILLLGLIFVISNGWIVAYKVVIPIEKINGFMGSIRSEADLSGRLKIGGSAEIRQLAGKINGMLEEIERSHQKLVAARERLQFEATHDSLTGCWNRAAALELLDRELSRTNREYTTVAVIMLDADHFKNVNDCYGHAAGDAVLKNVTAVISRNLRGFDVLARYGGEEFLIIAPNCNLEEAHSMTQRILQKLEEAPINVGQSVIHVTMSAGVTCGAAPTIAEDLIDASDGALYRAKARGRNRVEIEEVREMHSGRKLLIVPSGSV